MKASFNGSIICRRCEVQGLISLTKERAYCPGCRHVLEGQVLHTLPEIVALPDAHACECERPRMRRLPDGIFHCPACHAEVMPVAV